MQQPNESPLVSVIIASYNHGPYIEASIESVLKQTYPSWELLVIDDGSQDDSVERISKLQALHGFDFRVQKNQGLSKTLNEAISYAKGSLIVPFGSDDIMLPERLAVQVSYMQSKPEVGICAANIQEIDSQGKVFREARRSGFRRLDFNNVFLGDKAGPPAPTLMFRRNVLEEIGGFDPDIRLEDLLVELKVTRAGYYIDVLEDVLALYRVHATNTYKNYAFMVDNVLKIYDQFSDHPDYDRVCNSFKRSMFVKAAGKDNKLARKLLSELPLAFWDIRVIKRLPKLFVRLG